MAMGWFSSTNDPANPDSYDAIDRQRKLAQALIDQGLGEKPIQSWTQGAANIGKILAGKYQQSQADEKAKAANKPINDLIIKALMGGGAADTASPSMASASPSMPSSPTGSPGTSSGSMYRDAIAGIESRGSGDYGAIGPKTRTGDQAYGRYQVMGANIPSWTKEVLGVAMTPAQFVANKEAQDKVFDAKFGASVAKYGNPQDAASVWFTGRPQSQGANARDVLGTTGSSYVNKFSQALAAQGGSPAMALAPPQQPPQAPATQAIAQALQGGSGAPPAPQDAPLSNFAQIPGSAGALPSAGFSGAPDAPPQAMPYAPMPMARPASLDMPPQGAPMPQPGPDMTPMDQRPGPIDSQAQTNIDYATMPQAQGGGMMPPGMPPQMGGASPMAGNMPAPGAMPAGPQSMPAAPGSPPQAMTGPQDPQKIARALMLAAMSPGADPRMAQRAMAVATMLRGEIPKASYQTLPDGTVLQMDPTGRQPPKPVYQSGAKPTDLQRNYDLAKSQGYPGSFMDYQLGIKKAGAPAVNIDQKTEGTFDQTIAKEQAKMYSSIASDGLTAKADIANINSLRQQIGTLPGGFLGGAEALANSYGMKFGPNASKIEVANAIISKLVPAQRQGMPGAASDRDVQMFKDALPKLSNTPQGNKVILDTMEAMARYKAEAGVIANKVMSGQMNRNDGLKALQALPDPMEAFKQGRKVTDALDQAREAIAKGAPRDAVIKRLTESGIDAGGL